MVLLQKWGCREEQLVNCSGNMYHFLKTLPHPSVWKTRLFVWQCGNQTVPTVLGPWEWNRECDGPVSKGSLESVAKDRTISGEEQFQTESDTVLSRSIKSWVIRRRSHVSSYVTTKRHQVKLSESSFRQAQGSQVSTIKPWNYLPSDTVDGKVLQEFKKSSEIHRRKIDEGLGSIDSPALLQEIPD